MAIPVVRLLVLGVVRSHARAHGYAVSRELAEWRVETWTNVRPGSIYHALRQATRDGQLRIVGVEAGSKGPERTVYELTTAGETEFVRLMSAALVSLDPVELGAGMAFLEALPRARAVELLANQVRLARQTVANLDQLAPAFADRSSPPHTRDLLALWRSVTDALAGWTANVLIRVESGEFAMADDGRAG